VALNGDGGDESFAGYERYAAMQLAERYRKLPSFLRESVIQEVVARVPASELGRGRVKAFKRFVQAASLPKVDRYMRWMSTFNSDLKTSLYSDSFRQELRGNQPVDLLRPWFAHVNGSGIVGPPAATSIPLYGA